MQAAERQDPAQIDALLHQQLGQGGLNAREDGLRPQQLERPRHPHQRLYARRVERVDPGQIENDAARAPRRHLGQEPRRERTASLFVERADERDRQHVVAHIQDRHRQRLNLLRLLLDGQPDLSAVRHVELEQQRGGLAGHRVDRPVGLDRVPALAPQRVHLHLRAVRAPGADGLVDRPRDGLVDEPGAERAPGAERPQARGVLHQDGAGLVEQGDDGPDAPERFDPAELLWVDRHDRVDGLRQRRDMPVGEREARDVATRRHRRAAVGVERDEPGLGPAGLDDRLRRELPDAHRLGRLREVARLEVGQVGRAPELERLLVGPHHLLVDVVDDPDRNRDGLEDGDSLFEGHRHRALDRSGRPCAGRRRGAASAGWALEPLPRPNDEGSERKRRPAVPVC